MVQIRILIPRLFKLLVIGILILIAVICISIIRYLQIEPLEPLEDCISNNEMEVICEFLNPEDLAITPDEEYFIVSEYGGQSPIQEVTPGNLSLFHIPTRTKKFLPIEYSLNTWGDVNCLRGPQDEIGPHGIDLAQRDDGSIQLAVVSHLPNERVEMFELVKNNGSWSLIWRGCVSTDEKYYLNDVSLTKSGSFFASHMFDINLSLSEWLFSYFFKFDTGFIISWNSEDGFNELSETAGSYPNGIMLDREKNNLTVNYNLGDETLLFDLNTMEIIGKFKANSPDNVVLRENHIWVVSHNYNIFDYQKCGNNINCTLPWSVTQLDRNDLSVIKTYSFKSKNMGVGTVGFKVKDELWLGSFRSNRIAVHKLQ